MHELAPLILDALRLTLMLALPVLGIAFVVAAGVGLFQAATQLTEPSINAIARLLAGGLMLSLSARWMGAELAHYTTTLWLTLPGLTP